MRSTNILSSEKGRGVSTILGTLIFIGILFTSVIPMMLVMKQADTIYTKKIHELEIKDDEKVREELIVYREAMKSVRTKLAELENYIDRVENWDYSNLEKYKELKAN